MPLTEPACRLSSKPVSNLRYGVYTNKSYRISQTCVIYATHCLVYTLITCPIYFAFTSSQIVLVRQSADTCMLSLKDWKAAQCRWAPDGFLPCIKQSWCVLFFFFYTAAMQILAAMLFLISLSFALKRWYDSICRCARPATVWHCMYTGNKILFQSWLPCVK